MTCDIESIRRMVEGSQGDGRVLVSTYDPMQILFAMSQLLREVDRVWTLHPELATHNWRGHKE